MGLLDRPQQPQRFGLLSPETMSLIQNAQNMPVPAPRAPAQPQRRPPGFLTYLLGGSEGMAAERAAREAERLRPQQEAERARIAALVRAMPVDAQIAYALNPDKFGEALASRSEGRVLDQGDVYMSGETPGYAAPFEAAPGSSVFDPRNPSSPIAVAAQENKVVGGALVAPEGRVLYRGPQVEGVAGTADAFYTPEIVQGQGGGAPRVVREARPDSVTVAPGGEVISLNPDGSVAGRVASSQARPMSDADQTAVARADSQITSLDTSLARARAIEQQIASGQLNLGPIANTVGGIRNNLGMSDANSLNYDALMAWAKEARNAILQANTGVQTDQDAIRELDTILSSSRDERVVTAALRRFQEARSATRAALQRDIQRRSGQGGPAASGQASGPIAEDAQGNRVQWNGSAWVPI